MLTSTDIEKELNKLNEFWNSSQNRPLTRLSAVADQLLPTDRPDSKRESKIRNLVFQGGSVKGIAYLGALEALNHNGIALKDIERVGGTSAGAISATLVGLGYDLKSIDTLMSKLNFKSFIDSKTDILDLKARYNAGGVVIGTLRTAFAAPVLLNELKKDIGLCPGEAFRDWIEKHIKERTNISDATFSDIAKLRMQTKNPFGLKKIFLVGTNLNTGRSEVFSEEHTPNMIVADAVRISMSIPFLFVPHYYYIKNESGNRIKANPCRYIDGGVLDNFPIWLFDDTRYFANTLQRTIQINYETLGLRLVDSDMQKYYQKSQQSIWEGNQHPENDQEIKPPPINNFYDFLLSFIKCYYGNQESNHAQRIEDHARSIYINTLGFSILDFDLTEQDKNNLKNSGYRAGSDYFQQVRSLYQKMYSTPELLSILISCAKYPLLVMTRGEMEVKNIQFDPIKIPELIYEFYSKGTEKDVIFLDMFSISWNEKDAKGNTALHYAALYSDKKCLEKLIERKKINLDTQNNDGRTALDLVCVLGHSGARNDGIIRLVKAGARLICSANLIIVRDIVQRHRTEYGDSALTQAISELRSPEENREIIKSQNTEHGKELKQENATQMTRLEDKATYIGSINLEQLQKSIFNGFSKIENARGMSIVLVLGNTGVGKSTLINYLLGSKMKIRVEDGVSRISAIPQYTEIGDEIADAKTLLPNVLDSGDGFSYCDCPGFSDTRTYSREEEIISSLMCMQLAVKISKSQKIIIVFDWHDLHGVKATNFQRMISELSKLFPNYETIADSILFIITKVPATVSDTNISSHISNMISSQIRELVIFLRKITLRVQSQHGMFSKAESEENQQKYDTMKLLTLLKTLSEDKKIIRVNIQDYEMDELRRKILGNLKNLIFAHSLAFGRFSDVRIKFNDLVYNIAQEGSALIKERHALTKQIEGNKDEVRKINEKLTFLKNQLDSENKPEKKQDRIEVIEKRLTTNNRDIREKEVERDNIEQDITKIEKDLADANSNDLSIHHAFEAVKEQRYPWYGLGFLGWTTRDFEYKGIPFDDVIETFGNGELTILEKNNERGIYKARYTSWIGYDGIVDIKICIKKKNLKSTKNFIIEKQREFEEKRELKNTVANKISELKTERDENVKSLHDIKGNISKTQQEIINKKLDLVVQATALRDRINTLDQDARNAQKKLIEVEETITTKYKIFAMVKNIVAILADLNSFPIIKEFLSLFNNYNFLKLSPLVTVIPMDSKSLLFSPSTSFSISSEPTVKMNLQNKDSSIIHARM